ncbi:GlxA family transcriptional regulator [Nocardiopsis halophila]|uniref:GlxA family transcriptional regulator n=2 Tax=Nocardiopsis TaxID=2013 RepID=UPI000475CA05|nr:helix-turn-helix domain-containing protein [Nocardiopsis halophila]
MRVVSVLIYNGMSVFDYAVSAEVWGIDRTGAGVPRFELRRCGVRGSVAAASPGASVRATHGMDAVAGADLVVVPGGPDPVLDYPPDLLAALRAADRSGTPIAALCGAAFALGQAGLLRGRRATTHWMWIEELRKRFPDSVVEEEALFVNDGSLWTSAGTAAGIDLCLHLVRGAHGADTAAEIGRRMVTPPHRSGTQRQYIEAPVSGNDPFSDTLAWARENLHVPLTVRRLAARAGMSERTLARRFVQATGATPLRWLHDQRVQLAQRLLEGTDHPVEAVAHRAGFGSSAAMRRSFGRTLGVTPTEYRAAFRERGVD